MVSAEASTNLFGVMLAFHGMVLFAQEGRFRQLLVRTAVALLLGWHAVGLIAAFVPLALGRELTAARAAARFPCASCRRSSPTRRDEQRLPARPMGRASR